MLYKFFLYFSGLSWKGSGPHGPLEPMDSYEVATPSCATKLFLMVLNFNFLYGILKINTLK